MRMKKILLALIQMFRDGWQGAFVCCECERIQRGDWRLQVARGNKWICYGCHLKRARHANMGDLSQLDFTDDGLPPDDV